MTLEKTAHIDHSPDHIRAGGASLSLALRCEWCGGEDHCSRCMADLAKLPVQNNGAAVTPVLQVTPGAIG